MSEEKQEEILTDNDNNDNNDNDKYKAFVVMNGNSNTIKSKDNTLNIDNNIRKDIIVSNTDNNDDNTDNIKNEAIIIGHCTNKIISTSDKINDDCPNITKVFLLYYSDFLRKCDNECFRFGLGPIKR